MTERVTVGALTEGARILVTRGADGDPVPAKTAEGAEVATVTASPSKEGRKLVFETNLGTFTAGPTAKVLLAPPAEAPEVVERQGSGRRMLDGLTVAVINLDAAGRVTPDSIVTVGGTHHARVPGSAERMTTAPARLLAALSSLGFEPVSPWALGDGVAKCKVRPNRP